MASSKQWHDERIYPGSSNSQNQSGSFLRPSRLQASTNLKPDAASKTKNATHGKFTPKSPKQTNYFQVAESCPAFGFGQSSLHQPSVFHCWICKRRYPSESFLLSHFQCHPNFKPFRCVKCEEMFPSSSQLKSHEEKHVTGAAGLSKKLDYGLSRVDSPKQEDSNTEETRCKICNTDYRNNFYLKCHMNKTRLKICSKCGKKFCKTLDFKEHKKGCRGEKGQSTVGIESKANDDSLPDFASIRLYGTNRFLSNKMSNVNRPEENSPHANQCDICKTNFISSFSLMGHKNRTTVKVCPHCGMKFCKAGPFSEHKKECQDDSLTLNCRICKKSFSSTELLLEHFETNHAGKAPFSCKTCHNTFMSREDLVGHLRSSVNKPCNSKSQENLGVVIKETVSSQQPEIFMHQFSKSVKGESSSSHNVGNEQNEIETSYITCEACETKFKSVWHYESHVMTRLDIKCMDCGKALCTKLGLLRHMSKYHPGAKILRCRYCYNFHCNRKEYEVHKAKCKDALVKSKKKKVPTATLR